MITPSMQNKLMDVEHQERLNQFERDHRAQRHTLERRTMPIIGKLFARLGERVDNLSQPLPDQKRATAEIRGV